ncbi:Gfo/Idh/MocA family protein [Rhodohalobacter sulfatireducens]|uniref:Gfo/Idh/MocA family oxidoreductase n=1 Tax=Rhodohalobacter sulfatireducens TaxID=2911366 RepID=A0ABS9K9G2_9BACT|nr:Gfo/Idh/MocA family oxidoreductase [Rhodohalobacter sulfatireducens]MCG2587500.1 Gfo/Idh/MocA family oxidoreductase [Rhodohalobacter sulfatireducens]
MKDSKQGRREFLNTFAKGTLGAFGATGLLFKGSNATSSKNHYLPKAPMIQSQAPDGELIRAGLVGCGGRGTGAAINFLDAGPNLEIVALGDVFQDQLDKCRDNLKRGRGVEVADENCFIGFDAYQKVIDSDVDVVLFATPPHFRPQHVKAAIEAGKHVFQEKPVAVDPVGARIMMETTQKAIDKKLNMVSGTALRYSKDYIETHKRVSEGMIGEIIGGQAVRNGGALWWVERKPEWTDLEYMLRNWGNFTWLSGDHITEQHIHHLDLINWHIGKNPVRAYGYGGRQQRISGDQFDYFSIVYEYENGIKVHGATRQINNAESGRIEMIKGTKGYADCGGTIYDYNGNILWEYPYPDANETNSEWEVTDPFVQEHVELITGIRTDKYVNDSELQVNSTRMAIMGRMAAYTGDEITWDEILNSDMRLGPETYEFGNVSSITEKPPVQGSSPAPANRYS